MTRYTRNPDATSFRGRGRRGDDSPLVGAIRTRFYRDPGGASNGVPVYVHGPHGRQWAGYIVSEGGRRARSGGVA